MIMKSKQINKIISAILVSEFIYAFVKVMPKFLVYFDPTRLILWIIAFLIFALLLISAIGVFLNKKWGVVILWVFILLPILVRTTIFFRL